MNRTLPRHILFYASRVLLDDAGKPLSGMGVLLDRLSGYDRVALCADPDELELVRGAYGSLISEGVRLAGVTGDEAPRRSYPAFEVEIDLVVDADPLRAMAAVDNGLRTSIFVDAARLYRDLGLWGIVPLNHSLKDVRETLGLK